MITLPEAFEQEMKQLLGEEEYEAYCKTFDEAVHRGLRVNNGKISTEEFLRRTDIPLKKVPWIPNGFYYDEESCNPAKDADYYAGLYYLQEPSAMTPASRLPIEPDDRVLDLCAAPGGKATELGSRIGEGGMLLANDISNSRAKALLRNLEIQGVGRLLVTSEDPEKLVTLYPAFFDKILLDAPCSGEGMFRKESSMLRYYSENGPEHYVPIQKKLIEQAYQMLAEGGELLYSTCTFSVKENEEVIAGLLDAHPELAALGVDHNVVFCVSFLQAVADEQVAILYRGEHAAALGLREQEHLREQHPGAQQDHHNAAQQANKILPVLSVQPAAAHRPCPLLQGFIVQRVHRNAPPFGGQSCQSRFARQRPG